MRLVWSASIVIVIVAILVALQNRVIVQNESRKAIDDLSFDVVVEGTDILCHRESFRRISTGNSGKGTFAFDRDCTCRVTGHFEDGSEIRGGGGYLTNGMVAVRVIVTVLKDGDVEIRTQ